MTRRRDRHRPRHGARGSRVARPRATGSRTRRSHGRPSPAHAAPRRCRPRTAGCRGRVEDREAIGLSRQWSMIACWIYLSWACDAASGTTIRFTSSTLRSVSSAVLVVGRGQVLRLVVQAAAEPRPWSPGPARPAAPPSSAVVGGGPTVTQSDVTTPWLEDVARVDRVQRQAAEPLGGLAADVDGGVMPAASPAASRPARSRPRPTGSSRCRSRAAESSSA